MPELHIKKRSPVSPQLNVSSGFERTILEAEQPKFLTGWVPVVKIFNTKNRAVRILWVLFTVCMIVALVGSISVVVHRYLTYVTVVRLDQRGPQDGIPPPAITVCLAEHEVDNLPWNSTSTLARNAGNITPGISRKCDSMFNVHWNSEQDALSPVYALGGHFKVTARTDPKGCYVMSVLEQVPSPPNSICTTFELKPTTLHNSTFWKVYTLSIELTKPNRSFIGRPLVIVHERRSFPLDNFGRYLYEYLEPGSTHNLFSGKVVTKRLNTRGKPCSSQPVRLLGHDFDYDQVACQWFTVCKHYHWKCGCLCPLEIIHRHAIARDREVAAVGFNRSGLQSTCPLSCQHNYPIAFVNSSACPLACLTVTYKKLNQVLDASTNRGLVRMTLIQSEGVTEMTEEELYSLAKLFSEIGGLSSFCFGFSCILFFELIELAFWLRCTYRAQFAAQVSELLEQHFEEMNTTKSSLPVKVNVQTNKQASKKQVDSPVKLKQECQIRDLDDSTCSATSSETHGSKCSPTLACVARQCPIGGNTREIKFHPMNLCLVDGSRLSDYPDERDSPILGLKYRQQPQTAACSTITRSANEVSNTKPRVILFEQPHVTTVPCYVGTEWFSVPLDIVSSYPQQLTT
ncbi:hypothetical protein EG68_01906 [Paragonimus skrjabini miyazakii]|uniref:Amiloride-sensitive sodium channel n=1 Tax=Paragonimus skrjabini miyazakii TaxID=59628 RepID=A0A8S9Z0X5_9TREM|nr:hypothetical protein EG68_01906 [Paragonimus skrjabini miyazakii]